MSKIFISVLFFTIIRYSISKITTLQTNLVTVFTISSGLEWNPLHSAHVNAPWPRLNLSQAGRLLLDLPTAEGWEAELTLGVGHYWDSLPVQPAPNWSAWRRATIHWSDHCTTYGDQLSLNVNKNISMFIYIVVCM